MSRKSTMSVKSSLHRDGKRRKFIDAAKQGTILRSCRLGLAALLLATGTSGCLTTTVWHTAAHAGVGRHGKAVKALLIATPALLAVDLLLMPYQIPHRCYPYGRRYRPR